MVILANLAYPLYTDIIKKPMWLKKIKNNFIKNEYKSATEIFDDIKLIWSNCKEFNKNESDIYKTAEVLEKETDKIYEEYKEYISKLDKGKLLKKKRKIEQLIVEKKPKMAKVEEDKQPNIEEE